MRLSRIITDYRLSQNEAFSLVKCIQRYVQTAKWAVDHSGLELTSTFDEDMREKRFYIFIFLFSFPVTLKNFDL